MADGRIAVIGGGPAGLMAADRLSAAGLAVDLYERMPTVGRKFLLAGRSGLNITHSEPIERFVSRFGTAAPALAAALDTLPPESVRSFADALGAETFVGSSGRVFPKAMKASPLLRAWLARLTEQGVRFHLRHRWTSFSGSDGLVFDTPDGPMALSPAASVLALGGGSWPRLGTDGSWTDILDYTGVAVTPLKPSNMGFDVDWSEPFRARHSGAPVKSVVGYFGDQVVPGEFVVTEKGIEGGLVYMLSAGLRDRIAAEGNAVLTLDLVPGRDLHRIAAALARPRGGASFSNALRKATGLEGVKAALVREVLDAETRADPQRLAAGLKALPLALVRPRPIAEAISTAGGVALDAIDAHFMLKARPGVFVAGEMLDWEAPTGGYLITACLATGAAAAEGVMRYLREGLGG